MRAHHTHTPTYVPMGKETKEEGKKKNFVFLVCAFSKKNLGDEKKKKRKVLRGSENFSPLVLVNFASTISLRTCMP